MPSYNRHRFAKQIAFLKARLSPEGYLGLHLTIGALIMIGATWLFAAIAEDVVTADRLTVVDFQFSAWLHAHGRPWLTAVLLLVTNVHATLGVTIITLAVFLYLHKNKERRWALTLALCVVGGMLLNVVLKNIFHRARPHFDNPILTLTSYGFPSGHTMAATCLYGALAALAVSKLKAWPWRVVAVAVASLFIAVVGFSRIYLGAHYLSDVLGAIAEGLAWLAFCFAAARLMQHRLASR